MASPNEIHILKVESIAVNLDYIEFNLLHKV